MEYHGFHTKNWVLKRAKAVKIHFVKIRVIAKVTAENKLTIQPTNQILAIIILIPRWTYPLSEM